MTERVGRSQFEASLASFRWKSWITAMLVAVLLNCGLFLFLPVLMNPSPVITNIDQIVNSIQVIRLKKDEIPPQKKKPKPPEQPKEKPKPKEKVIAPKPKAREELKLPFTLNTRLPSVTSDFQLQYAENVRFGPLGNHSVDKNDLDQPLTAIARIPPVYPLRARRRGTEGWVKIGFEVDKQGNVDKLHIIESEPPGIFDKSVLQCVSKWRYKPGTVEGIAVRARTETVIRFELE